jgi:hypothetical protein
MYDVVCIAFAVDLLFVQPTNQPTAKTKGSTCKASNQMVEVLQTIITPVKDYILLPTLTPMFKNPPCAGALQLSLGALSAQYFPNDNIPKTMDIDLSRGGGCTSLGHSSCHVHVVVLSCVVRVPHLGPAVLLLLFTCLAYVYGVVSVDNWTDGHQIMHAH